MIHKGTIELKVRFAVVFASMYSLKVFVNTSATRPCSTGASPFSTNVTNEERDAVTRGKAIFEQKPHSCPKEVTIGRKDFERICDFWTKNSGKVHDNRALDDCLRVFADPGAQRVPLSLHHRLTR